MGRPARFTEDDILDAALQLFAGGGGGAVRMKAVAEALGAPSGSIYHRFPSRGALVGALWNRTTERFLAELQPFLAELQVMAGAEAILGWCEANPIEASLLQAGPRYADVTWPEAQTLRHRAHRADVGALLKTSADRLGIEVERLSFALVDVPMATVRRQLVKTPAMRAIRAVLPAPIALRWLEPGDEALLRRTRLRALLESPEAFASSFDDMVARPTSKWASQIKDLPTVLAFLDGRSVGMVRGVPGTPWELISLWVAPEVRGAGVGRRLIDALGDRAGALRLGVKHDNTPAIDLYERLGFTHVSKDEDTLYLERF